MSLSAYAVGNHAPGSLSCPCTHVSLRTEHSFRPAAIRDRPAHGCPLGHRTRVRGHRDRAGLLPANNQESHVASEAKVPRCNRRAAPGRTFVLRRDGARRSCSIGLGPAPTRSILVWLCRMIRGGGYVCQPNSWHSGATHGSGDAHYCRGSAPRRDRVQGAWRPVDAMLWTH